MKPARRWTASERIAARILEERGFQIVELHKRINIGGVDVAEVDIVARGPDGSLYAVEVKAGKLNVQGVRQAYANAALLKAKPLVICKGFADKAAEETAKALGVDVIVLEDLFIFDPEELEDLIYYTVLDAVAEVVRLLLSPDIRLKPSQLEVIKALASSTTIDDAAKRSGRTVQEVAEVIDVLRRLTPLARRGFRYVVLVASILALRYRLEAVTSSLEEKLDRLEKLLSLLGA